MAAALNRRTPQKKILIRLSLKAQSAVLAFLELSGELPKSAETVKLPFSHVNFLRLFTLYTVRMIPYFL